MPYESLGLQLQRRLHSLTHNPRTNTMIFTFRSILHTDSHATLNVTPAPTHNGWLVPPCVTAKPQSAPRMPAVWATLQSAAAMLSIMVQS